MRVRGVAYEDAVLEVAGPGGFGLGNGGVAVGPAEFAFALGEAFDAGAGVVGDVVGSAEEGWGPDLAAIR